MALMTWEGWRERLISARSKEEQLAEVLAGIFADMKEERLGRMPLELEETLMSVAGNEGNGVSKAWAAVMVFETKRRKGENVARFFMKAFELWKNMPREAKDFLIAKKKAYLPQTLEEWEKSGVEKGAFAQDLYQAARFVSRWKDRAAVTVRIGLEALGREDVGQKWWERHLANKEIARKARLTDRRDMVDIRGNQALNSGRRNGHVKRDVNAPAIRKEPRPPEIVWTRKNLGLVVQPSTVLAETVAENVTPSREFGKATPIRQKMAPESENVKPVEKKKVSEKLGQNTQVAAPTQVMPAAPEVIVKKTRRAGSFRNTVVIEKIDPVPETPEQNTRATKLTPKEKFAGVPASAKTNFEKALRQLDLRRKNIRETQKNSDAKQADMQI